MPPVSKIAQLPDDIRRWLHQTLVDRAFGDITGVTQELRAMLERAGVPMSIGRSAVGDESQRIKRAQAAIRATTEATRLIAETARDDEDTRSEAALALVQSEMFEVMMAIQAAREEAEPSESNPAAQIKLLDRAALALSRMSRARVSQARWRQEVEGRAKEAADAVAKITKTGGLTPAQQDEIRSRILGITKVPAKPAAA